MFDNTKLDDYVRWTLKDRDPQNDCYEIRAAASRQRLARSNVSFVSHYLQLINIRLEKRSLGC